MLLQAAGVVGLGEAGDPLGGGGEQHPVPGLAGSEGQSDGQVGLIGAGRAEQQHVLPYGDEVQGAQVGDQLALEASGVVEVELLQALAGRKPCGADAALAAVGLPGGDLPLQAGPEWKPEHAARFVHDLLFCDEDALAGLYRRLG